MHVISTAEWNGMFALFTRDTHTRELDNGTVVPHTCRHLGQQTTAAVLNESFKQDSAGETKCWLSLT